MSGDGISSSGVSSFDGCTPASSGYSFELSAKYSCAGLESIVRTNSIASFLCLLDASTPTPETFTSEPRSFVGKCTLTG